MDLDCHNETQITFLGDIDCDEIYMDAYTNNADWTSKDEFTKSVSLLDLSSKGISLSDLISD